MLDNILIVLILFSIVLSFFIVKVWKKKNFVKELYISEGVSIAFYVITIAITIGLLTMYCISSKGLPYSWLFLVIVLIFDWMLLFVFCIVTTTCIYLKDNTLIKKNIVNSKQITLNKEIKIIEKFDKRIIKSREKSISISSRYLTGNIKNFMNNVKIIIMSVFGGKILLITGGTGSFGNAVLRRFLDSDIREIRIFSRDEKKQDDMRHALQNPKVKFYIGDVRNKESVDVAMKGVNYVFSAAALKQVPSCEFFPIEAVKTNIQGTENVLNSAIEHGVESVVVLSTDKAAYPINAMGMSKALMEKVAVAKGRELGEGAKTTICCTRYGNVMASRGSVIPLWVEQMQEGKPITITDPEMTRFMMTLDDAVDLVVYAFTHAHNGDLFVQKAPAATLHTLAEALKEIYGQKNPEYLNPEVKVIGTRHGEKLYETLVTREEMVRAMDMGEYYRIPCDTRDLNYDKYFTKGSEEISKLEDYHSHNTRRLDVAEMKELLLKLRFIREDMGLEQRTKARDIRSE